MVDRRTCIPGLQRIATGKCRNACPFLAPVIRAVFILAQILGERHTQASSQARSRRPYFCSLSLSRWRGAGTAMDRVHGGGQRRMLSAGRDEQVAVHWAHYPWRGCTRAQVLLGSGDLGMRGRDAGCPASLDTSHNLDLGS
jgi:hypothetical protein